MHRIAKSAVVLILVAAAGRVVVGKRRQRPARAETPPRGAAPAAVARPRLLEAGGGKCPPCKMLESVLAVLRREYGSQLRIETVNILEDEAAAARYRILWNPTLIFFDPAGKELHRNEGFMSGADIVAKWRELGYELTPQPPRKDSPEAGAGEAERDASQTPLLARVFGSLTRFVRGAPAVALAAALVWGILSVLLSPCHLASIPLIIGFIDAQGRTTPRRAFATSSLFAVGILITIGAIGGVTAAAGRMLGDVGAWAYYVVAAIFLLVGLVLMDVVPMPWSGPGQVAVRRRGLLAAFLLGLVFGVAIGPCTFAYMAPMLGVTFTVAAASVLYGVALLVAYGVGHCSVIVAAGTSAELVQRYLNWNERSKGAVAVKRACGALVALGGIYLIYIAP